MCRMNLGEGKGIGLLLMNGFVAASVMSHVLLWALVAKKWVSGLRDVRATLIFSRTSARVEEEAYRVGAGGAVVAIFGCVGWGEPDDLSDLRWWLKAERHLANTKKQQS